MVKFLTLEWRPTQFDSNLSEGGKGLKGLTMTFFNLCGRAAGASILWKHLLSVLVPLTKYGLVTHLWEGGFHWLTVP